MKAWVDGRRGRTVDLLDRGLQYGDGLFETMYVEAGHVRLLELHLDRLSAGLKRLGIGVPLRRVRGEIAVAARGSSRATLKLIVTRGSGERGYRPRGDERARRILLLSAAPAPPAAPVRLRVCRTRLAAGSPVAGLKTLGRLESVLARREWHSARIFEGLMRDAEDHIVCGTMTNLFLRRGATLYTPSLENCGVAGVMRRWILQEAGGLGIRVRVAPIVWRDLVAAEEVFVSNALIGVRAVRVIEWRSAGRPLEYGNFELADRLGRRLEVL